MRLAVYVLRRLLWLVPQLFGITAVTFVIVRLLPGNPIYLMGGPLATAETLKELAKRMALDQPLHIQFWLYLRNIAQGDLGMSWYTSKPVLQDIFQRFPATLELVTLSLLLALIVAVPFGLATARKPGGWGDRTFMGYGFLAGALPDFWWGLMLIFIFYFKLNWFPAPLGRIDVGVSPPDAITGMYFVDSLLTRNWEAFRSSAGHLVLPVVTLAFVYGGGIVKQIRQNMLPILQGDFIRYAMMSGLPEGKVARYALRNVLPPVVTLVGMLYGFLIGGAVLVEYVFGWGGMGQYAVQSIITSDYFALQGVVLVITGFSLIVYLAVDLIYAAIDPRISY